MNIFQKYEFQILVLTFLLLCISRLAYAAAPSPGADCTGLTANSTTCFQNGCYTCTSNVWTAQPFVVGVSALGCSSTYEGMMRWSSTYKYLEYCDGTDWNPISQGSSSTPQATCGGTGSFTTQQLTTLTISSGCTVEFKVWGAGGGGYTGVAGGGGGYATITLGPLGATTTYYLAVGGGGGGSTGGSIGDGGASLVNYTGGKGSASGGVGTGGGGGASGIWTTNYGDTPVVVAGGGGGASYCVTSYASNFGTQAGGTTGTDGSSGGAGGGGGYTTGGAGSSSACTAASGGSNYAASGGTTAMGYVSTPGNPNDSDRPSNAGNGGTSQSRGSSGAIWYKSY